MKTAKLANTRLKTSIDKSKHWFARLELAYKKAPNKTLLSHRLHQGPLVIQKPFYPEADVCHSYLIHPPGGIVGGDVLELDVVLQPKSHVLITTPAANKFYRSQQRTATLTQIIHVEKNATLEWLPQETIFYNECDAEIQTEFHLSEGAHLSCWEINCYGRPAGKELFTKGIITQKIVVKQNGKHLYIDRNVVDSESNILNSIWGLSNFSVMATMLVTVNSDFNLEKIKSLQKHIATYMLSFTLHNDLLVIRYLGHHAREALVLFTQCWSLTRPQLLNKKACPPRIWAT